DREQRWQTAQAMLDAIRALLPSGSGIHDSMLEAAAIAPSREATTATGVRLAADRERRTSAWTVGAIGALRATAFRVAAMARTPPPPPSHPPAHLPAAATATPPSGKPRRPGPKPASPPPGSREHM